jgi:hypothetical protein
VNGSIASLFGFHSACTLQFCWKASKSILWRRKRPSVSIALAIRCKLTDVLHFCYHARWLSCTRGTFRIVEHRLRRTEPHRWKTAWFAVFIAYLRVRHNSQAGPYSGCLPTMLRLRVIVLGGQTFVEVISFFCTRSLFNEEVAERDAVCRSDQRPEQPGSLCCLGFVDFSVKLGWNHNDNTNDAATNDADNNHYNNINRGQHWRRYASCTRTWNNVADGKRCGSARIRATPSNAEGSGVNDILIPETMRITLCAVH